jgi:hypothetical protein
MARHHLQRVLRICIGVALLPVVAGCGSDGVSPRENPQTTLPPFTNYTGPAPQTDDVQRFKLNVWDNLVPSNRCGSCHDVSQAPRFARSDDINLAYEIANTLVDLNDPSSSLLVTRVRNGHHCWLQNDDACGDVMTSYIQAWAGASAGSTTVELTAPIQRAPGASRTLPATAPVQFGPLHDLLTSRCATCHSPAASVPQSPLFANSDIDAAYAAARDRINIEVPSASRFVVRLRDEFHNCWSDCASNADDIESAIAYLVDSVPETSFDESLVTSMALGLFDGLLATTGSRHEANVIALYEFKTGAGNVAFDTSGVEPALNLTFNGTTSEADRWVGGWGINLATDDKWQGTTTTSRKLHQLITATGEYSLEAWVAPGNVSQDGPARIVTYAGSQNVRNFALGQTLYNYDFLNRATTTSDNGLPALSTADANQTLQATLQHVVLTFTPANGRVIYVNGTRTDDDDSAPGGSLADWDDTFALAVGREVDNTNGWQGQIRLLAIHNRARCPRNRCCGITKPASASDSCCCSTSRNTSASTMRTSSSR